MNPRPHKLTYPALFEEGFTPINLADIDRHFLGSVNTPRRKWLASMLTLFVNKLVGLGVKGELWVNGSFSTKNPEPMDFDALLLISPGTVSGISDEALVELEWITGKANKAAVRDKWNCDLYVISSDDFISRKAYETHFSRNPDDGSKKGIAVIKI